MNLGRITGLTITAATWKVLVGGSMALVALGVNLWVIRTYGNPTPYWDQWNGEGMRLYVPFNESRLGLDALLLAHNEHRILTGRLIHLALLAANGLWDPILQMIVNVLVRVAVAVLVLATFGRTLYRDAYAGLAVLVLLVFGVPLGWENSIIGFQTPSYLLLLFGLAACWLIPQAPGFSERWLAGATAGVLGFFSLASGALVLLAGSLAMIVRQILGVSRGWREWLGAAVLAGAFIAAVLATPQLAKHEVYKAHSVWDFLRAFLWLAGWPIGFGVLGFAIVQAPAVLLAWRAIRKGTSGDQPIWAVLCLWLWCGLSFASLAYGRGAAIKAERYLEMVVVGLVANYVCAAFLADTRRKKIVATAWAAIVAAGLIVHATEVPRSLERRLQDSLVQEANVKAFLATGAFPAGAGDPLMTLPFPGRDGFAVLLSDPRIRRILPSNLQAVIPENERAVSDRRTGRLEGIRDAALAVGGPMAIIGFVLFVFLILSSPAAIKPAMR